MTDRSQTAKVILAVQAALRANGATTQRTERASQMAVLKSLRSRPLPIGDVAKSAAVSEWTAVTALQELADAGLVSVAEDEATVEITDSGRAALK